MLLCFNIFPLIAAYWTSLVHSPNCCEELCDCHRLGRMRNFFCCACGPPGSAGLPVHYCGFISEDANQNLLQNLWSCQSTASCFSCHLWKNYHDKFDCFQGLVGLRKRLSSCSCPRRFYDAPKTPAFTSGDFASVCVQVASLWPWPSLWLCL